MNRRGRGLILAAPHSGSGKTLVTAALLRHLRLAGVRIAAAKVGPDYIDPGFHALASGRPSINLDPWAMRCETLQGLVAGLEEEAEIVLCEGVMGLFDGTGADGEMGSTADLAARTGWPVVLVVDARGQGASVAALLRGFAGHRPALTIAGVIFNRVAGRRHRWLLEDAVSRHLPGLAMFGAVPAAAHFELPSRHLGLVPAAENGDAEAVIAVAAAQVGGNIDVARLLAAARGSKFAAGGTAGGLLPLGRRIAVARDEAFAFAYPAVFDFWRRQGADLAFFSPLAGEVPPQGVDAVYLPGGYPQLHPGRLAAAAGFIGGLVRAAAAGKPVYGECGGYMVLGESLVDSDGRAHAMAGLLPLVTSFAERRLTLGYRAARLLTSGPLGAAGARFRGHEFHYATVLREGPGEPLWSAEDAAGVPLGELGLRRGSVSGSFLHLIDAAPCPLR
jgi:cobyrinic acid a,c-diamide synthase